ncbi:MAG: hypothetical protein L3J53_06955 [Proteobacteria bacterium]|nr:hypothetical protein [Pseudomonadota bacterium]
MKKLLTLLLITNVIINTITNMTIASNSKNQQTDKKLNESLALAYYFKEIYYTKLHAVTVGADGACNYSTIQAAIDAYSPPYLLEILLYELPPTKLMWRILP